MAPLPSSTDSPTDARPSAEQPRSHGPTSPIWIIVVLFCFIVIALERTKLIPAIQPLATTLYQWFILLSAFGILLGVGNVFYIHLRRIVSGQEEWGLSLALVATGLATLMAGLVQQAGVTGPIVEWIFDALLAPGSATLYALLVFFLAAAAYRYLRLTTSGGAWMVAGVLFMLLVQMPASANFLSPIFAESVAWLLQVPIMAVFRGALLGSVLALLLIGTRYLIGRAK